MIFTFCCSWCFTFSNAQSVGIGTTTPNTSSQLDISSSTKGILIPRMKTSTVTSIINPAKGLMVYDTAKNQLMVNMGTAASPNWQTIVAKSGWALNGNSATNPATQFIGTGDSVSLILKAYNKLSGYIDVSGNANTSFGYKSLLNNTTGFYNTAIGSNVLVNNTTGVRNTSVGPYSLNANTTGSFNTAMGLYALGANVDGNNNIAAGVNSLAYNTNGNDNTAYGTNTLLSNTSGYSNVGIGKDALLSNISGVENTANGYQALYNNKSGSNNTSYGMNSLFLNVSGGYNTACGNQALYNNTTGSYNTAIGFQALISNTTGIENTAIGHDALSYNITGHDNVSIGSNAGSYLQTGNNNVFIGDNTNVNGSDFSNVIAIGSNATCTASEQVTMGDIYSSYRAYANWSNISDGRFKKNIQENVPGLDFIMQLRPITYNLNATGLDAFLHTNNTSRVNNQKASNRDSKESGQSNDAAAKAVYNKALQEKETAVCTGFVAQEVEVAANKMGFNFSGVDAPKNENDVYSLRYAEFVVPLVKAVQEQQAIIKDLQKQIDELKLLIKK